MIDPELIAFYTGNFDRDLAKVKGLIETPGLCAIDLETTVARARDREVCTIQVTHESGEEAFAYVYPRGTAALRTVLVKPRAKLVAFNSLFESECFVKAGVEVYPECAMIAAKVLRGTMQGDKSKRIGWSLKECCERYLGKTRDKTIRDEDWTQPPTKEMIVYGMDDTRDALELWQMWQVNFDHDPEAYRGYRTVVDALPCLVEINLTGLPLDAQAHAGLTATLKDEVEAHVATLDLLCWGEIKNPGSTKQVGKWVMDMMMANCPEQQRGLPHIFSLLYQGATGQHWPTTKTGDLSFDRKVIESRLEGLTRVAPDVAEYLIQRLQWSKAAKLVQAFGDPLRQFEDEDGYVRGSMRPHGAQTSRMSCASPNLQQMPSEEEFRALFRAKRGRKLVIADYGQIELRVGCIIADDKAMQQVFAEGRDIHSATFENVQRALGTPVTYDPDNKVHVKGRKDGKPVTFSALYGAMAATIAANGGISLPEAEKLLDAWLTAYPGIRVYRNTAFDKARREGGVRLVSGQFIGMANDTRPAMAINAPVQGSAASVMYRAMYRTHRGVLAARKEAGADIRVAACIHDEMILDCAEEDAEMAREILETEMTQALLDLYPVAAKLGIDNIADAAVVDSWAEK